MNILIRKIFLRAIATVSVWSCRLCFEDVLFKMSRFKSVNPFRELLNPTDIYSAQSLLIKLSLISGIAPLKLTGKCGNRRLQVNLFGFVILIIHMCIFAFCYIRTITVHDSIVSYFFKTEISVVGDTLQLCIGLIGISTVFLNSFCKRQTFILWFHLMARIDEELKQIGIETDYKSTLKFICLVLMVKFIFFNGYMLGSYVLFNMANVFPNYTCWISFFLPHLMISIIVVLFLCFVKQMKHRFLLLNKVRVIQRCYVMALSLF
jgi:gustatory receptor